MNPTIYKKSDEIKKEFTTDIESLDDLKAIEKWDKAFLELELAETSDECVCAVSSIFQAGARHLRVVPRYEKFRLMYHALSDAIPKTDSEHENG